MVAIGLHQFIPGLATFVALCMIPSAAVAHPHVFVVDRSEVLFDASGKVAGIRHAWTFDEMYSAFATEGLGSKDKLPTKEELAPLAKTNVESLAEFGFFTVAKAGGHQLDFGEPVDYTLEAEANRQITLHFTLPLKQPASAGKAFSFQVYDPTYFVSFEFAPTDAIAMKGAPSGCSSSIFSPKPLEATESKKLSESFFSGLSPGADFGIKLASRAVVACP